MSKISLKETDTHVYFWGSIFSQWAKCSFIESDVEFNTAEQYMMYKKATIFGDYEIAKQILKQSDPREQKALGRKVKNFDVEKWNDYKFDIVCQGNLLKFFQNKEAMIELLKTGNKILVEGSPYDKVWGVGLKWDDPKILSEKNWQGENLLGKALMEVRETLKDLEDDK
jgi:hypothetical protein